MSRNSIVLSLFIMGSSCAGPGPRQEVARPGQPAEQKSDPFAFSFVLPATAEETKLEKIMYEPEEAGKVGGNQDGLQRTFTNQRHA